MNFLAIYPKDINLGTGLLIALISIALVFVVLLIIILSVEGMHLFFKNKKEEVVEETVVKAPVKEQKSNEIKDEDMMVAALIATIEFNQETKEDAKLVSIKQIG